MLHVSTKILTKILPSQFPVVAAVRTWAVWAMEKRITYVLFGTYTMASAFIMILYIMSLRNTSGMSSFIRHLLCKDTELRAGSFAFCAEQIISGVGFPLGCNPQFDGFNLPAAFVVEAAFDAG